MNLTLTFTQIEPYVRYAQFITITSNRQYVNTASYDYRFFYCSGGSGEIIVQGVSYPMKEGSALLWAPGLCYSLQLTKNSSRMDLVGANFDYTQNYAHLNTPISPAKWRNFKPENILQTVTFSDHKILNQPIYVADLQTLRSPMYRLTQDFITKKPFFEARCAGLLKGNLALMARAAVCAAKSGKSERLAEKVVQYINSHYPEEINNRMLGELFGYHPNHLNRVVLQLTDMTVHRYLIHCRINAAVELLQASDMKTAEIAAAVGFKEVAHFLKYFKKITGKTTKEYR